MDTIVRSFELKNIRLAVVKTADQHYEVRGKCGHRSAETVEGSYDTLPEASARFDELVEDTKACCL